MDRGELRLSQMDEASCYLCCLG